MCGYSIHSRCDFLELGRRKRESVPEVLWCFYISRLNFQSELIITEMETSPLASNVFVDNETYYVFVILVIIS